MPAVVKSTVGSFSGTRDAEAICACPLSLKNPIYALLSSSASISVISLCRWGYNAHLNIMLPAGIRYHACERDADILPGRAPDREPCGPQTPLPESAFLARAAALRTAVSASPLDISKMMPRRSSSSAGLWPISLTTTASDPLTASTDLDTWSA